MGLIRDSFVIFKNWSDAINALPEEYQLETYKALVNFGINGEIPQGLSSIANAMLISFSVGMKNSICRYSASVENGQNGGRPRKNDSEVTSQALKMREYRESKKPITNQLQTNYKPIQTHTNLYEPTTNLNDNVNDNVNVNIENSLTRVKESGEPLSQCECVIKESKPRKHKYGEYKNVLLTDDEYQHLIAESDGIEAIEYLSFHREMKGYKCKSDNLAIRKWVFTAVLEERQRKAKISNTYSPSHKESPIEQLSRVCGGDE